jgi:hypothetical protein
VANFPRKTFFAGSIQHFKDMGLGGYLRPHLWGQGWTATDWKKGGNILTFRALAISGPAEQVSQGQNLQMELPLTLHEMVFAERLWSFKEMDRWRRFP